MNMMLQRTIKRSGGFSGIGLHSGVAVNVTLRPAGANTGIVFERTDLPGRPSVPALATSVDSTILATQIRSGDAVVCTIEHFMAALFALGIDNVVVGIDGPEFPILDGSAVPFLVVLDELGVEVLSTPRRLLVIKESVEVVDPKNPERFVRVEPSSQPMLSYIIDFADAPAIGRQTLSIPLSGETVCRELSFARTFCRAAEIEYMRSRGLARGGTLENAIVVDAAGGLLNARGLRSADEFVRHKALDCVGDLALVGLPMVGHVIAHKAGHDLHVRLAAAILESLGKQQIVALEGSRSRKLSGLLDFPLLLPNLERIQELSLVRG